MTDTLTNDAIAHLHVLKEFIQRHGWIQGDFGDPGLGGYCLLGAGATCVVGQANGAQTLAWITLRQQVEDLGCRSIPYWNDYMAQSVEDVYALIDQAIVRLSASSPAVAQA